MQVILLIFVAPAFVFLGLSGYSVVNSDPAMVEVGDLSITKDEFTQAQRNQLQQLQQSSQGRFDPAMLDNPQARQALVDQLINYKIQIAVASADRFSVSDTYLRDVIATMPEFQDNGRFSADRYNDFLAAYGISPRDFEASKRGELALDIVLQPIDDTAILPTPVLDSIKKALTEERNIRLKTFNSADYAAEVNVSDDDIKNWYENNQDQLRLPQQVVAEYMVLDEAAAMASVPAIDVDKLQEYYEQNKSNYVVPGRVNASHILVKLPSGASDEAKQKALDKASDISNRLKSDSSKFAEVAKDESQDAGTARNGGELGWIQRGTLPLDMEQAVFALASGAVSEPIKGADGYHIFIANQVEPEHGESFDDARAKIEDEVQRQLAAEKFADMATNLTSLVYDDPTSLEPASKSLGLEIRTASGISRDNLLEASLIGPNAASSSPDAAILDDVRVRQSLFSNQVLNDKQNSGVIEISPDTMVVVRVKESIPAHVPDLDTLTDKIKTNIINERSFELAKQAGNEFLANIDPDDESYTEQMTVSRLDHNGLSKEVVDAALSIKGDDLPSYGSISLPNSFVVIKVDGITAGTTDKASLSGLGSQLSRVWGASEEQAYLAQLRQELGVVVTPEGQKLIQDGDGSSD